MLASEAAITHSKAEVASSCYEDCDAKFPSVCGQITATGIPRYIPALVVAKIQTLINAARRHIELVSEDNDDGTYTKLNGP